MVVLSLATGLRRSEVCGLKWDCVNDTSVVVRRALIQVDKALHLKEAKTEDSHRPVTLPSSVVRILASQRARQAAEKLAAGEAYDDEGYVFATAVGQPVRPVAYTKQFKATVRESEFKGLDLHSLRHCHASQLIADNINIKTISARLGHSGIGITLDTYGHLLPGMDEAAAATINESF